MNLTGRYEIPAPRARVWQALNDPAILKTAIPGCSELQRTDDHGFKAMVTAKVGPISATFQGEVVLSELDPPNSYVISGRGQGGVAGFAKGSARIQLSDGEIGTVLDYVADVDVGGKLATVGSRLIQGVAKKNADEFFTSFVAAIGSPGETSAAQPALEPEPLPAPSRLWLWALACGAAVIIALFLVAR